MFKNNIAKRYLHLSFVIGHLSFCLVASQAAALPFRSDLNKGNDHYRKGEYSQAQDKYNKILEKKSSELKARFNLGDALYKQGKFSESENIFSALTSEAQDVKLKEPSFYNMGNAQFRQENYAGAVQAYEAALKIDPKDEDARYNLALAQKMLKMPKKEKEKQKAEKQKSRQEKDKEKAKAQEKTQKLNREDAERILQGINGNEKHKAPKVKAGKGNNEKDW